MMRAPLSYPINAQSLGDLSRERKNLTSILFLIRSLNPGGAERQLVLLARELAERGVRVSVAVFYGGGQFEADLAAAQIEIHRLDKRHRWDVLGFLYRLRRIVTAIDPDVLHSYATTPNLVAALLKPLLGRTKVVWGVRSANMDWGRFGVVSRLGFEASRVLSRFADLIIANSAAGATFHVAAGYPARRTVVVPNAVDPARFAVSASARMEQRAKWGISAEEPLIGIVGRLDPMKDHHTFLSAASLYCKRNNRGRFVVVGGGPESYRQSLQAMARSVMPSERVIWIGHVAEPSAVYNALDIVTSSSIGEGTANTILEALITDKPCVVTDVGDSAAVVMDCGVVVPPQDPEALAAAWERVLLSPLPQGKCMRRASDHYGPSRLSAATLSYLQAIL